MTSSFFRSSYNFFMTGIWFSKFNVIFNGIFKQINRLKNKAEITNKAVIAVFFYIMTI